MMHGQKNIEITKPFIHVVSQVKAATQWEIHA
jgi:hypothetical protein